MGCCKNNPPIKYFPSYYSNDKIKYYKDAIYYMKETAIPFYEKEKPLIFKKNWKKLMKELENTLREYEYQSFSLTEEGKRILKEMKKEGF